MTPKIVEEEYGRYIIKAGVVAGKVTARAFRRPPSAHKGIVAEASGETVDEAIAKVKVKLDEQKAEQQDSRRQCDKNLVFVPSVAEYRDALRMLSLSDKHVAMLRAHAAAGGRGLASHKIAAAAGYATSNAANSQYGSLGRQFAEHLDINLPAYPDGRTDFATSAIGHEGTPEDGSFVWVMYDELRQALADEGIASLST